MPLDAPGVERFSAAVLFADISGFTPLAERLARRGPGGAEELSALLNAYFAELMALIAEHGGGVMLGVAHFDPPPPEVLGSHTIPPSSAVRRSTSVDDLGCRL
jgi:hypothetical protein